MEGKVVQRPSLSARIGLVAVAVGLFVSCAAGKTIPKVTVTYQGCTRSASSLDMMVNVANPNAVPLVVSIDGSFSYDGSTYRGGSQLAIGGHQSERWQVSTQVGGPASSDYSCKVTGVKVSTT